MRKTLDKNKREILLILLCAGLYTLAYLGKYSFTCNKSVIKDFFGITQDALIGLPGTLFFFAYGVGQVVNGLLCKYYNKRIILSLSLLISAGINFSIFLGIDFVYMPYLWLINGFAQSFLWSSLVLVLGDNLSKKRLKTGIFLMSITTCVGTILTYATSAFFVAVLDWHYSFLLAFAVLATFALLWFFFYNSLTLKKGEKIEEELPNTTVENKETAVKTVRSAAIFTVICLGFFAVVGNLVKDGLTFWTPSILKQRYALPDWVSMLLTISIAAIGILGPVIAMQLNKKITDFVLLSGILFLACSLFILAIIGLLSTDLWVLTLILLGLTVMLMHGIGTVFSTMAPLELRGAMNPGLLAGVLNGCGYIGSTISDYGLGAVKDALGWNSVFILLLICCAIPVVFCGIMMIINANKKKKLNTL